MVSARRRMTVGVPALSLVFSLLALTAPGQPRASGPTPAERFRPAAQLGTEPSPTQLRRDVARFRTRVEAALSETGADKGYWAVLVTDAKTGEVLYALNPQRYFLPASNTKIFTTGLALATLGPDYRFRTTLETRGSLERSGRLLGDLVLVGRGDPNLSNRKFPFLKEVERDGPPEKALSEFADVIVARGINLIEGNIVADDSYFGGERFPSGWTVDDLLWGYGAAVSAIAVNDNTISLELRPGEREGDPAGYRVEPWTNLYKIQNEIRTGPPGTERKLEAARDPGSHLIVVRGTMPVRAEPFSLTIAVEDPAEHAAALLKRLLEARGVRIHGEPRARHLPDPAASLASTVLAEHTSVPLIQAVRFINKVSQNLHTELLLRTAARERVGALTMGAALKFAQDFYQSIGIAERDLILSDGSGLSRRNLITPQAAVKLLQHAAQQPWGEAYRSTFPIAGEDGTLSERMKATAAAGRIQAKTGTLEHAAAISGYATTAYGTALIFSMFVNNHGLRARDATAVLDALCVAMVEELGAPAPAKAP